MNMKKTDNSNRIGQFTGEMPDTEPSFGGLSPELYEIAALLLTFINTMDTGYNRCVKEEQDV